MPPPPPQYPVLCACTRVQVVPLGASPCTPSTAGRHAIARALLYDGAPGRGYYVLLCSGYGLIVPGLRGAPPEVPPVGDGSAGWGRGSFPGGVFVGEALDGSAGTPLWPGLAMGAHQQCACVAGEGSGPMAGGRVDQAAAGGGAVVAPEGVAAAALPQPSGQGQVVMAGATALPGSIGVATAPQPLAGTAFIVSAPPPAGSVESVAVVAPADVCSVTGTQDALEDTTPSLLPCTRTAAPSDSAAGATRHGVTPDAPAAVSGTTSHVAPTVVGSLLGPSSASAAGPVGVAGSPVAEDPRATNVPSPLAPQRAPAQEFVAVPSTASRQEAASPRSPHSASLQPLPASIPSPPTLRERAAAAAEARRQRQATGAAAPKGAASPASASAKFRTGGSSHVPPVVVALGLVALAVAAWAWSSLRYL